MYSESPEKLKELLNKSALVSAEEVIDFDDIIYIDNGETDENHVVTCKEIDSAFDGKGTKTLCSDLTSKCEELKLDNKYPYL